MKPVRLLATLALLAAPAAYAAAGGTYVGVVTDTMCKTDHRAMKIAPDPKCVRECVGDGRTYKYALAVNGQVYTLSDQETPARYAGRKVKVTGVLYPKTGILKVETIAAAD